MNETILLIEDDPRIPDLIEPHIKAIGFDLAVEADGEEGLSRALSEPFAAIILDWNLPKLEGIEICRRIRIEKVQIPILMLTGRAEEIDRILGLEMGADDYLVKPFSPRELTARIKAVLRRVSTAPTGETTADIALLQFGPLRINPASRQVFLNEQELGLTAKEFDLLICLAGNAGVVFSRDRLLEEVWGYTSAGYESVVTSFMSRLRSKLEPHKDSLQFVVTLRGAGYRFKTPAEIADQS